MKRLIFLFLFLVYGAAETSAAPDLATYLDVDNHRIYRDHKKRDTFYMAPAPPKISLRSDRLPEISLDIYRYLGRRGTGDSGEFSVKGILGLGISRELEKGRNRKLKKALSSAYKIKFPKLRSISVSGTTGTLIFADMNIEWSQPSRWSGKKISVPLDIHMSQILWDAVEKGQTLISIEMQETLSGVRKNENNEWEKNTVVHASTLPVTLDMQAYPSLFRKIDLGGRMAVGYTGIDVFCFDFIENLDDRLYSKMIEVAIPTPGKPLVETLTFSQDSSPRERIEFKLAKDLDTAYKVRITHIYTDGTTRQGAWQKRIGEAMLDITDYRENNESEPDQDDQAELPEE